MMETIALYARVSSEQQKEQATIASQIAALEARAASDGHIVLVSDQYIDEGVSGATLIRPGLERLRDRVAEGGVDLLYVHSPDRLARRYAYQVVLLEEFARHGTQVVFVNGPSGQSAEDELLVQVQGMIAEYERAKILERCRRGKLHKARTGVVNPLSGAPYGYMYVRRTETEPARYQIVLHEAKVVRQVFSWYVEEQVSIGEIVRRLADEGIETRTGKSKWDRSTIWAMLKNPAYMGHAAFGKTQAVERGKLLRPIRSRNATPRRTKSTYRDKQKEDWIAIAVPAIVSAKVFDAAAEQLARNKRLAQRNQRGNRYLLQGLTVCAKCGYAFYGKTVSRAVARRKNKDRWAYYRCVGSDAFRFEGGRVCHNPQVRVEQLDAYVWDSVQNLLQDPQRMLDEWSTRAASDGTTAQLKRERDEASQLLRTQHKTLCRLRDAYEAGALELDDLVQRSDRVRSRIQKAKENLDHAERVLSQSVELTAVAARLSDFARNVKIGLDSLTWLQRRQLIRTLVARVEIDEEGANIVYRVPSARTDPGSSSPGSTPDRSPRTGGSADSSYHLCGRGDKSAVGEPVPSLRTGCVDATQSAKRSILPLRR
jgi:site-specific DNA recombinase